jgi:hypothetical protein
MFVVGKLLDILIVTSLLIFWIWTLVECTRRKQLIWVAVVLLTSVLGAIAYWWFGRGPRPHVEIPPQPLPPTSSFPNEAANFSLFAPLVAIPFILLTGMLVYCSGLSLERGNGITRTIGGLFSLGILFLPIFGIVLGIVAIVATRRHESTHIFWKALLGTCINGFLCLAMLMTVLSNIARLNAKHGTQVMNKDWFAGDIIQVHHRSRPAREGFLSRAKGPAIAATDPVFFAFDRKLKLTSLKVVPVSDIETKKYPQPIWDLVSDSNSVPITDFAYGMYIEGMRPSVQGATPDPLEPGVIYRLLIETTEGKAEHDFVPVPRTP